MWVTGPYRLLGAHSISLYKLEKGALRCSEGQAALGPCTWNGEPGRLGLRPPPHHHN